MGTKQLRYAAGALGLALATGVAAMPLDSAAAAGFGSSPKETSWSHAVSQIPEVTRVLEVRHVVALANAKLSLRSVVRTADDLFASSKGKSTDASRRTLAVERNRAYSLIALTDDPAAPPVQQQQLSAAVDVVKVEVAAWEAAEAKRKAEEARKAELARLASSSRKSGGGAARAQAAGQTPKQYLEGLAAGYGASISWSSSPCGRFGSGTVGGCYQGGSTVYVSDGAYASWAKAQGRGRSVVIHEASHMIIQKKCGTVLLGGTRFENVTDAYSVLLGGGGTGYGYNDSDMALAQAALGGQCLG